MQCIEGLNIKIFADGADKTSMLEMAAQPYIKGLTTNPTLMHKAGIHNYKAFAQEVLSEVKDKPISFEVFSDDFSEMERQALEIASWGSNVYIKIPVMNTQGKTCYSLIEKLSKKEIKLNITAIMTLSQTRDVINCLTPYVPSYVSIFAGRIADTGRDPVPLMAAALELLKTSPGAELIWASPREFLNVFQANSIGCHIITMTYDLLKKLKMVGYDLETYSLDTVKMFYEDAVAAGFSI